MSFSRFARGHSNPYFKPKSSPHVPGVPGHHKNSQKVKKQRSSNKSTTSSSPFSMRQKRLPNPLYPEQYSSTAPSSSQKLCFSRKLSFDENGGFFPSHETEYNTEIPKNKSNTMGKKSSLPNTELAMIFPTLKSSVSVGTPTLLTEITKLVLEMDQLDIILERLWSESKNPLATPTFGNDPVSFTNFPKLALFHQIEYETKSQSRSISTLLASKLNSGTVFKFHFGPRKKIQCLVPSKSVHQLVNKLKLKHRHFHHTFDSWLSFASTQQALSKSSLYNNFQSDEIQILFDSKLITDKDMSLIHFSLPGLAKFCSDLEYYSSILLRYVQSCPAKSVLLSTLQKLVYGGIPADSSDTLTLSRENETVDPKSPFSHPERPLLRTAITKKNLPLLKSMGFSLKFLISHLAGSKFILVKPIDLSCSSQKVEDSLISIRC